MRIINSVSRERWNEITCQSPDSTFFHTYQWLELLENIYGYKIATKLFLLESGKEVLIPQVVVGKRYRYFNRTQSLPLGCYGGFISKEKLTPEENISIALSLIHKNQADSIIHFNPLAKLNKKIDSCKSHEYIAQIISLKEDLDFIWHKKFVYKARKQVRKSERNNITFERATKRDQFEAFIEIYRDANKRWKDPNAIPGNFILGLYNLNNHHARLWNLKHENKIIAGLLEFSFNDNIIAWLEASNPSYWKYGINDFLYWSAIKEAKKEGYLYYNLGCSILPSVRKFKKTLGAEEMVYPVYTLHGPIFNRLIKLKKE